MRTYEHGPAGDFGGPLTPDEIEGAVNFDDMRLGPLVEAPAPTRLRLGQGQAEYWGAEPGTGMTVQEYQFRARRGMPPRDPAGNALPGPWGDANTRMRVHSPDPVAPAGSTSANEWTINMEQGNIRMTEDGKWFDPRFGESPAGRIDLRPYRRGPDGSWIVGATGAPVTEERLLTALEQWERDMASSHIPLIKPPAPPTR